MATTMKVLIQDVEHYYWLLPVGSSSTLQIYTVDIIQVPTVHTKDFTSISRIWTFCKSGTQ